MTRGIYIRWIIGSLSLLLIIAVGCFIYYNNTTASYKQEVVTSKKLLIQRENDKQANIPTSVENPLTETPTENITRTEQLPTTTTQEIETLETTSSFTINNPVKDESKRISKYGFGEYPEFPTDADFPLASPNWDTLEKTDELVFRVLIKAWNKGERFVGARLDENGKILLNYPNTVYVKHIEIKEPDGTISKIRNVSGPPGIPVPPPGEDFPSHIRVLDNDTHSIDPYEYLNIPTKGD